ncbi:MAG: alpha/beta fold hydrolase [Candidatus Hermodarchaeota archaeon]
MSYIKVNDLRIFYYDNNQEGIPLLFIHGWLGSSLEWSYQLYHFNPNNHIILLDLPGFGKSDKPTINYSVDFFTKQIIDFLNLLGYNEVILIGHSLGGLITLNITINRPDLVKKLVLISTPPSISHSFKERVILFCINLIFKFRYVQFLKSSIKKILGTEIENHKFRKLYTKSREIPKSIVLNAFKNMTLKFELKKRLESILQPTLIIYGTEDSIISNLKIRELNKEITNSKLIPIINGSHRLIINNHEKINTLVEDFIVR